jgi:hypothetical protein
VRNQAAPPHRSTDPPREQAARAFADDLAADPSPLGTRHPRPSPRQPAWERRPPGSAAPAWEPDPETAHVVGWIFAAPCHRAQASRPAMGEQSGAARREPGPAGDRATGSRAWYWGTRPTAERVEITKKRAVPDRARYGRSGAGTRLSPGEHNDHFSRWLHLAAIAAGAQVSRSG